MPHTECKFIANFLWLISSFLKNDDRRFMVEHVRIRKKTRTPWDVCVLLHYFTRTLTADGKIKHGPRYPSQVLGWDFQRNRLKEWFWPFMRKMPFTNWVLQGSWCDCSNIWGQGANGTPGILFWWLFLYCGVYQTWLISHVVLHCAFISVCAQTVKPSSPKRSCDSCGMPLIARLVIVFYFLFFFTETLGY